ncbi:MAG: hypothetical protein V1724_07835, partial [Chloroflexota bacterium]
ASRATLALNDGLCFLRLCFMSCSSYSPILGAEPALNHLSEFWGPPQAARQEMKALRDKNLNQATFEEKLDIIATLGIRVYPSEDLKSVKVTCGLNIPFKGSEECEDALECRKVMFGSQFWIKGKTRTFEKTFALVC